MGSFSKLLPYSCYELGHCWNHSCTYSSLEICIIAFIESCKIYGVVYLLTGLINTRKISFEYGRKLLKGYLTSVCFLTVNAFGYVGSFCVLRYILRHVNFLTASFLPGFIASFLAIQVERRERRSLLAIYVANVITLFLLSSNMSNSMAAHFWCNLFCLLLDLLLQVRVSPQTGVTNMVQHIPASECLWNTAVGHGYVKPIPRGEILVFVGAMAVLGYSFRSSRPLSKLINSILQLFLGRGESGVMIAHRQVARPVTSEQLKPKPQPWPMRLLSVFTFRHPLCPHRGGCLSDFFWVGLQGFSQGFLLQLGVKLLSSASSIVKAPWKLNSLLLSENNIRAGIFLAWFASVFKGTCCAGRWWHGKDEPSHGALAGILSALSMYFYSAPSLALYMLWKAVESLYEKGCDDGYLPRIPGSVEILYSVSTGYLFHMAIFEKHYMKPSYWRFLKRLTWDRMITYNRHLLACYGLNSSRDFVNYWPDYDLDHISDAVKQMFPQHIAKISL